MLRRAREFGGLTSKLPPLPGVSETKITPSEHFMWYLTEAFAEPDLLTWYEASVEELVSGNEMSRTEEETGILFFVDQDATGIVPSDEIEDARQTITN